MTYDTEIDRELNRNINREIGMPVDDDPAWTRARNRAAVQAGFYAHLVTYLLVGAFLVILDVATGAEGTTFLGLDWAFWPLGGWGIGVVLHAFGAFGPSNNWQERKATELYEQERRRDSRRF